MALLRSKLALAPIFGRIRFRLLCAHFSSNLNKLGVENDLLVETNLMMKRAKLYLLKYSICHFVPFCAIWCHAGHNGHTRPKPSSKSRAWA